MQIRSETLPHLFKSASLGHIPKRELQETEISAVFRYDVNNLTLTICKAKMFETRSPIFDNVRKQSVERIPGNAVRIKRETAKPGTLSNDLQMKFLVERKRTAHVQGVQV